MKKLPAESPLAALSKLTLEELDGRIAELQAELDEQTARLGGEIDSLKLLRKAVDIRVNGKPERKPRQAKQKGAKTTAIHRPVEESSASDSGPSGSVKSRILRYLKVAAGSKASTIAADIQAHHVSVCQVLRDNDELFYKDPDGKWYLREAA